MCSGDGRVDSWSTRDVHVCIISGATRCLARAGLEGASISTIARESGVARQSIYNHFGSLDEFRKNRIFSPLIYLLAGNAESRHMLDARAIAVARKFIEPIREYLPPDADIDLDEMTETLIRIQLSVLTLGSARTRSPARLRAYLHRVLVPALGLTASAPTPDSSRGRQRG
jgi:AcrR family transcriptional regulator